MTRQKPWFIGIELRLEDVEAVYEEYEAENPGKTARDMDSDEFAARMRKKIMATVKVIEGGNA